MSRLAVVGDVLLDRDVLGAVDRVCPDAPAPVLDVASDVARPGAVPLGAAVDVVEPMGMETLVHFFIGGVPVIARCDPMTTAAPGEPLPLFADMGHMHLMEADGAGLVV